MACIPAFSLSYSRTKNQRGSGRHNTVLFSLFLCTLLCLAGLSQVFPPATARAQNPPVLWVDGSILESDVPPTIVNQRVLVPLGVLARYFGVHAQWHQELGTAYLFLADSRQMALTPGRNQVWIWRQTGETDPYLPRDQATWELEKTVTLDVAPVALNGRIMVPLGFIASEMGLSARWDSQAYAVRITSPWFGKYDPSIAVAGDLMPSIDIQSTHPDIVALAEQITSGLEEPGEKLLAVHDWVATHISYDVEDSLTLPIQKPQDALSVLRRRTAVCSGYSNLTAALLRSAGIPSRVVNGWARQPDQTWAEFLESIDGDFLASGNHSWNEVLLGDRWVPVDVTWDAGTVKDRTFVPRLSHRYLDPPPDVFADDHSKVVPLPHPPDPSRFYFRLGEAAQREIVKLASSFATKAFWYYPGVGLKDGDRIEALQLIVVGESPERGRTYLLHCRRIEAVGWTVKSFTEVAPDYPLPSGGYPYDAPWNR